MVTVARPYRRLQNVNPPGNELPDRLLTAKQAAEYLGYSEGTIRNKASAGEIPTVKLGTALRFRLSDLQAWVDEQDAAAKAAKADETAGPPKADAA